jgi:hypothetical protein
MKHVTDTVVFFVAPIQNYTRSNKLVSNKKARSSNKYSKKSSTCLLKHVTDTVVFFVAAIHVCVTSVICVRLLEQKTNRSYHLHISWYGSQCWLCCMSVMTNRYPEDNTTYQVLHTPNSPNIRQSNLKISSIPTWGIAHHWWGNLCISSLHAYA